MDPRRKRLLFRCQHCGMKENDILLGRFAGRHMADLDDADVERLEAMLEAGDSDLYDWLPGKVPVPSAHDHSLLTWFRVFNDSLRCTP